MFLAYIVPIKSKGMFISLLMIVLIELITVVLFVSFLEKRTCNVAQAVLKFMIYLLLPPNTVSD